ncbi:MAG: hypothetical protein K2Y04_09555 [Caulobacteraceae bacterium]|nr:hypothetical protein [Caulobacteraceae bacterium]
MRVVQFPLSQAQSQFQRDSSIGFIDAIRDASEAIAKACDCLNDPEISNESALAAEELVRATKYLLAASQQFRSGLSKSTPRAG